MAFTRETYNVIVQPVGGDGIRFVSYRTDDSSATVTGAGYFVGVATSGARVSDLVFVTPLTGPGEPYTVVMVDIDADGNGTAELSPSDTALQPSDIGVTVQGWRAGLDAITPFGFSLTAAADAVGARTVLELGSAAEEDSSAFQPADVDLTAIAALTSAANKVPYATGAGTWAMADLSAFGRTLIDDADATAARSTLGVVIGTNVQAFDADLSAIAALTSAADKLPYATGAQTWALTDLSAFARTILDDADAATARTTLGASALRYAAAAKSANYTVVIGDIHGTLTVDSTGASRTITLLAAATALSGFTITVVKADTSVNTVTIDGNASETIDGALTKVLRLPYQSATLVCDGSQWVTVAETNTIQSGSTADGRYTRWADGTQKCWVSISDASGAETASGSSFQNAADLTWTFPATFTTATHPVVVEGALARADRIGGVSLRSSPGNTNVLFRYWSTTSIAAGATVTLRLEAVGNWF